MKTILKAMFSVVRSPDFPCPLIHSTKKEIIDDEAPNGIVIVTIDKAGDEIIRIMNESQLPYIHDPKLPASY